MLFTDDVLHDLSGRFVHLKSPSVAAPAAQRDPEVITRVAEMLGELARDGLDAVARYARDLDGWQGSGFAVDRDELSGSGDRLEPELRAAIELGAQRTQEFARSHRDRLGDFEVELAPGLLTGVRYVPVSRVGAYLPAGRFPLTASAFMTVGVAKAAGVPSVIACKRRRSASSSAPSPSTSSPDRRKLRCSPMRRPIRR